MLVAALVAAVTALAVGAQIATTASPSAPSSVVTIDPVRVLDTRSGVGQPAAGPVGPDSAITLQIAGREGIPLDATGVIVTLTATLATDASFVTAWPTGIARPEVSVLNFRASEDIANTVTLALGTDGRIDLYNSVGSVHLIADVAGYLVPAEGAPGTPPTTVTPTTVAPTTPPGPVSRAVELTAYGGITTGNATPVGNGCINLGTNGSVQLDVPLLHGSAPTSVTFRYYDSDTANFTMALQEIAGGFPGTPGGALVDSQTQSTGAVGYGARSVTPIGADTVSSSVRYSILALTLGQSGGGQHWFCGATVEYLQLP